MYPKGGQYSAVWSTPGGILKSGKINSPSENASNVNKTKDGDATPLTHQMGIDSFKKLIPIEMIMSKEFRR